MKRPGSKGFMAFFHLSALGWTGGFLIAEVIGDQNPFSLGFFSAVTLLNILIVSFIWWPALGALRPTRKLNEPLVGYRAFFLDKNGIISGFRHEWPTRMATAVCECYGDEGELNFKSVWHSCGIYMFKDMGWARRECNDDRGDITTFALCVGWGKAAIHERGYRVEHARVEALSLPWAYRGLEPFRKSIEERYGVPVTIRKEGEEPWTSERKSELLRSLSPVESR